MPKKRKPAKSSIFFDDVPVSAAITQTAELLANRDKVPSETAIVYCEDNLGEIDGKIATDLVRHSEKYKILSIIDSEKAGEDAGAILDGEPNGIPIFRNLGTALAQAGRTPDCFIFGITPANETLSPAERRLLLRAIEYGMNVVTALHAFLNDDPEFAAACVKSNVVIRNVEKPRAKSV